MTSFSLSPCLLVSLSPPLPLSLSSSVDVRSATNAEPLKHSSTRRLRDGGVQLPHHFMPQLAKLAQGDHRLAVELRFEVAQLVGRLAETAELLGERFGA